MIYINYKGHKVPAENDGTLIEPPIYWGAEILAEIKLEFDNGNWESVPEPPPPQEPQWTAFNTAMLSNKSWQNWAIPSDLRTALISSSVNAKADSFQSSYDLAKSLVPPSAEAITEWQGLASAYHVQLVL